MADEIQSVLLGHVTFYRVDLEQCKRQSACDDPPCATPPGWDCVRILVVWRKKKTVVKKKLFVCLYLQQKEKNDRNRILAKIKQLKKHF